MWARTRAHRPITSTQREPPASAPAGHQPPVPVPVEAPVEDGQGYPQPQQERLADAAAKREKLQADLAARTGDFLLQVSQAAFRRMMPTSPLPRTPDAMRDAGPLWGSEKA